MERLILVIEDDAQIRRFLRNSLPEQGYRLVEAERGEIGLSLALQYVPDLVLLDLGLPDRDGVEVLRRLRAWSEVPVVVISARERERQKIEALDAGADDYLTKPFGFGELLARMRVALRRAARRETDAESTYRVGPVMVDFTARRVELAGEEVHLTPIEHKLLGVLVRHAGRVVTHRQILDAVWGPRTQQSAEPLRVHLMHLRRKLGVGLFRTEPGVGVRMSEPDT